MLRIGAVVTAALGARPLRAVATAVVVGVGAGCLAPAGYRCESDSQCDLDGEDGRCQPTGYCAYPDDQCPSGLRYESNAEADLADRCVPGSGDGSGTQGSSSSGAPAPPADSTSASPADAESNEASGPASGSATG